MVCGAAMKKSSTTHICPIKGHFIILIINTAEIKTKTKSMKSVYHNYYDTTEAKSK